MSVFPAPGILTQSLVGIDDQNRVADGGKSFTSILNKALGDVNSAQLKADDAAKKFLTGELQDVHQVVIAMEEARLTMQLALEVRNKVIEAYQEISRMQV